MKTYVAILSIHQTLVMHFSNKYNTNCIKCKYLIGYLLSNITKRRGFYFDVTSFVIEDVNRQMICWVNANYC